MNIIKKLNYSFTGFFLITISVIILLIHEYSIFGYNNGYNFGYYLLVPIKVLLFFICFYQNKCSSVKQKITVLSLKFLIFVGFLIGLVSYYVYVFSKSMPNAEFYPYLVWLIISSIFAVFIIIISIIEINQALNYDSYLNKKNVSYLLLIFFSPIHLIFLLITLVLMTSRFDVTTDFVVVQIFLWFIFITLVFAIIQFLTSKHSTLSSIFLVVKYFFPVVLLLILFFLTIDNFIKSFVIFAFLVTIIIIGSIEIKTKIRGAIKE